MPDQYVSFAAANRFETMPGQQPAANETTDVFQGGANIQGVFSNGFVVPSVLATWEVLIQVSAPPFASIAALALPEAEEIAPVSIHDIATTMTLSPFRSFHFVFGDIYACLCNCAV